MKRIYMDHAATTPVDKRVLEAMRPYFSEKYGNASSLHFFGQEAAHALQKSRESVASFIGAEPDEIIFTSGGTESNNLALKGVAFANKDKGKHIITCAIEHDCVLNAVKWLGKHGFDITILPVDKYGFVSPENLEQSIRKDTVLVSIMHANNEIGTIEPIKELCKIAHEHDAYFHTDAVQTTGKITIDVEKLGIDMLSMSSHKIYGPKGVGALFVKTDTKIEPIAHGGGHENGLRSGTENVAGIVGLAQALEIAKKEMKTEMPRISKLRNRIIKQTLNISDASLNGHPEKRLPINANFFFRFIEGEALVLKLDEAGIATSTGSACSSKSLEPSHVLMAIGLKPEEAHGSLRITLGKQNTNDDVDYLLNVLPKAVEDLRKISPFKGKKSIA